MLKSLRPPLKVDLLEVDHHGGEGRDMFSPGCGLFGVPRGRNYLLAIGNLISFRPVCLRAWGSVIGPISGGYFGFRPPLKVDHHQPLKVDHHGGPCRIRSTFKGGCVHTPPLKRIP